ncbi:RNA-directed DNA polymerase (Reverse transcriptase) [Thalictrum thalictroides]|uniref:RNA-directed DNA polymerase (Reverse transcriptase) n=1 Tax=Thalictrum thalictroides TaxID=46969 RepID=A0A7J6W8L1_THATH|nr:RNA-directed DNA polymerase (Reverse transcriptase) [Thalictrum thalictroides]
MEIQMLSNFQNKFMQPSCIGKIAYTVVKQHHNTNNNNNDVMHILVDKIQTRACGWASKLLSLQGRVVLIQSILNSMSIYNMGIYQRPTSCIQEAEAVMRNFLWTGDPEKRKLITLRWEKV